MSIPSIREVRPADYEAWLALRRKLWPDSTLDDLRQEQSKILAYPGKHCILGAFEGPVIVGFLECSLREWAEGCSTHPVGYIEGWYVETSHRGTGVGRGLVEAAECWASSQGCSEMASDADPDNRVSLHAHAALGYIEVGRAVLFTKRLS